MQADPELLEVLELATDEELEQVHALLAGTDCHTRQRRA